MSSVRFAFILTLILAVNILNYVFNISNTVLEPTLPSVFIQHAFFPVNSPKLIPSCTNNDVYATTSYAFVSLLSLSQKLDYDIKHYVMSAVKLGMSIRRFTNLDLLLMISVEPGKEAFTDKIILEHYFALTDAEWKICLVPNIQPLAEDNNNRLYQARVFQKLMHGDWLSTRQ